MFIFLNEHFSTEKKNGVLNLLNFILPNVLRKIKSFRWTYMFLIPCRCIVYLKQWSRSKWIYCMQPLNVINDELLLAEHFCACSATFSSFCLRGTRYCCSFVFDWRLIEKLDWDECWCNAWNRAAQTCQFHHGKKMNKNGKLVLCLTLVNC